MNHAFDEQYWDDVWSGGRAGAMSTSAPNPHLVRQVGELAPGAAIDAGCGAGAEAVWLAAAGWTVTAADVAGTALAFGERRAAEAGVGQRVRWVQADLSTWEPEEQYDLVTTHYAHPAIPQLEFYRRIATWVGPHGTLLIVGHLHHDDATATAGEHEQGHGHGQGHGQGHRHSHGADAQHESQPPAEASATAAAITELLDPEVWQVVTAEESQRTAMGPAARRVTINDVVVRATRRH
ncbi:class I SAM-dependent methyltransferase [Nocardioides plantarum]|uniref:Class I SAM-dependent methyltransferase n=1 Tax=Nocardioides plantarum TaxID=29299 RepID=A0ABV5K8E8_9ACTN|nr:class I SAM-dependent methyltransferase [Nocardioides plantarum]